MEMKREILRVWVIEALRDLKGSAYLLDVADHIWTNHADDLSRNRKLLLKWQYEMRWAATSLRRQGLMKFNDRNEPWSLTEKGMSGDLPWA